MSETPSQALIEVLDGLEQGVGVYERDGSVLYANEPNQRLLGKSLAEMRDHTLWDLFPATRDTDFHRAFDRVAAGGGPESFEHLTPEQRWFHRAIARTPSGQISVATRDITASKASEDRQRSLFNSIDDGFCVIEVIFDEHERPIDYRFLELNDAFEQHTGLKSSQGKRMKELVPEMDESWFRIYGKVALTGQTARFENFAPALGGRWFEVWASRLGAPELRQVAIVFKNITERKQEQSLLESIQSRVRAAEETRRAAVEQERARLRKNMEQAPVAMAVLRGPELAYELANPRYARMVGRTQAQLVGKTINDAFPELTDESPVFSMLRKVLATGQSYVGEEFKVLLDRKGDGTLRDVYFQLSCEPMRDDAGLVESVMVVAVDVTPLVDSRLRIEALAAEREHLLASEQTSRAEAEEANRLKDEFLSTVSHELRTPLTSVLGWVQMLRTNQLPPDKQQRGLETIERNARAQGQLIEDLLDVSRIMSGKLRLEFEPIELSAVVEQALETVRPTADAKGVRLEVTMRSSGVVSGDAHRLGQVVWNLLSNAVKFTPAGGSIRVDVERNANEVQVTVADTGQGVAKDFVPHLFRRFAQADAGSRREHSGLGLGLSIVKNLVEMHGGTVSASSEGPGRGATFVVKLPVAEAGLRRVTLPAAHERPVQLEGLHVLVADDDRDTRDFLRALLESCHSKVTCVSSAKEGIAAIRALRPRIVISDIGMPDEDGYAFIGQLRALPAADGGRTPAVALTAYARKEDRSRALLSGFDNHVSKPVEPSELLAVLAALASRE